MLSHLDLFSGIGGFALAARWAGIKTVGFCELEEFPRQVLARQFPGTFIHRDIKDLDGSIYERVNIITGGFPCQPFSITGVQSGFEDHRYLWPEMFRVIAQARPTWVIAENVTGIIGMVLDEVQLNLECEGYSTRSIIIPACAKNAPHRRDRVWIIAHNSSVRTQGFFSEEIQGESTLQRVENVRGFESIRDLSDIHTPRLCGAGNGIPRRVDRLESIGNAIVPQVAYELFKAINGVTHGNERK